MKMLDFLLNKIRFIFSAYFLCFCFPFFSQTTLGTDKSDLTTNSTTASAKHKVLIVPFGDKLYMSEIDHAVAAETKLNQSQIRFSFQDAVDDWLYKKMKLKFDVVSLFSDTLKNKKDLGMVYSGLGYNYDKVPSQKNYVAPSSDYNRELQIKNGNIETEINSDARFMNAKIINKQLLTNLNKKFGTDVFVFINELDLKAPPAGGDDFGTEKNRNAIVHYTCFTLQNKEVNSGIVTVKFPKNANDPQKIVSTYLSKGLEEIVLRLELAMKNPK